MTHATIARGLVTAALVFLATWMLHDTPATRMTAAEQNLVRGGDGWTSPGECVAEDEYGAECYDDEAKYRCSRGNAYCQEQKDYVPCVEEVTFSNPTRCKSAQYVGTECRENPSKFVNCYSRRACECQKEGTSWTCVPQDELAPWWNEPVGECEMRPRKP